MSIPIGLQLFVLRGETEKNLPAVIEGVAKCGYQGAEPWGYTGETLNWQGLHCRDIRRHYDDNGLICCGLHLTTEALNDDNLSRTIEFNKILSNRFLIVAMDPNRMKTDEGVLELANILNNTSEKLQQEGMYTGYHAHGFDFATLENGQIAWDMLFSHTNPEVIMQLDIGNCASGGGDPIGTLRKFPGRARSVHLKDFGGQKNSVIGEGLADWPEIFHMCETAQNTEWYVVEEGGEDGFGFDIPRRSLQALRKMGK